MAAPSNPIAFVSYARINNIHNEEAIASLCDRLSGEIGEQTGLAFSILRDQKDIKWGERWQAFIEQGIQASTFLIVIMTPAYFRSSQCRAEFEAFKKREAALGRRDLILPIYYVECEELDDPTVHARHPWARELKERQYEDWRHLRLQPVKSTESAQGIARLASQIKRVIRTTNLVESQALPASPIVGQASVDPAIVEAYRELTGTQRDIIQYMYGINDGPDILLEDLFKSLSNRDRNQIKSRGELYYRIKDLAHSGFVETRSAGPKTTVVLIVPSVKDAFIQHKIIES